MLASARARGSTAARAGSRAFVFALPALPALLGLADAFLVNGVRPGLELGVSVAAAVALLVRKRWPVAVLAVTLVGLYVGYIWFAPMIALYTVTARRRSNALAVVGAVSLALAHYVPYPLDGFTPSADRQGLLDMLDSCVQGAAPAVFGRWSRTRQQLRDRIRELTASRHREAELLAERAVTTERARLAREMHDVVAHQVSLISVQAGALQVTCRDETSRATARTVRELAVRTLVELRHMVGTLRSGDRTGSGLAPQPRLRDLPALAEQSGLPVTLDLPALAPRVRNGEPDDGPDGEPDDGPGSSPHDGPHDGPPPDGLVHSLDDNGPHKDDPDDDRLTGDPDHDRLDGNGPHGEPHGDGSSSPRWPDAVERAAYRTVQEALTNVRKHAPGAKVHVTVRVCRGGPAGTRLAVAVRNGPPTAVPEPGFPADGGHRLPDGGHGLLGLRERALLLGGAFAAEPTGDGGFLVTAEFPAARS
ncbi:two-component sensor histidine kinase [Streptomyces albus subsp. chlorinus]|nr:histidine kinase [Streptomyces albus]NSC22973.1 two-component sensor histidine kinase [Streptomyces albus subsp. chlorinus]